MAAEKTDSFLSPLWEGVTEGRIVHVRVAGVNHCQPAIVVRKFGDGQALNLQVFRDGSNDLEAPAYAPAERLDATRWTTSVQHEAAAGEGNGQTWHWPERV